MAKEKKNEIIVLKAKIADLYMNLDKIATARKDTIDKLQIELNKLQKMEKQKE